MSNTLALMKLYLKTEAAFHAMQERVTRGTACSEDLKDCLKKMNAAWTKVENARDKRATRRQKAE